MAKKAKVVSVNVRKAIPKNYDADKVDEAFERTLSDNDVRNIHQNSKIHSFVVIHAFNGQGSQVIEHKIDDLVGDVELK